MLAAPQAARTRRNAVRKIKRAFGPASPLRAETTDLAWRWAIGSSGARAAERQMGNGLRSGRDLSRGRKAHPRVLYGGISLHVNVPCGSHSPAVGTSFARGERTALRSGAVGSDRAPSLDSGLVSLWSPARSRAADAGPLSNMRSFPDVEKVSKPQALYTDACPPWGRKGHA
jgi:hypothetical protein